MSVDKYFQEGEYLPSIIKNYNYRPYQAEFSSKLYDCLFGYKTVVAEAPTGYGKTLSYLIPVFELGRKTIISTKSKQLMNQIMYKDIPVLRKIFGDEKYRISSLLGRKNYYCHYRYARHIVPYRDFYGDIVNWIESVFEQKVITIPQGVFDGEVVNKITADSYQCVGAKCEYYQFCSFYNAKEIANNSDIIITNHHMLLADIAMKTKFDTAYNFDYVDHIIFDEAHSLIDIFPSYLGEELNLYSLISLAKDNKLIVGDEVFQRIVQMYKNIVFRYRNKTRLDAGMIYEFEDFLEKVDKIFCQRISEEDYKIFEKYKEVFERIYKNDGIKMLDTVGDMIFLKNIPVTSGDKFAEGLYSSCISSIMISATISFNGSFDYFINELGLGNDVEQIQLFPPENFISQGKLYIHNEFLEDIESKKAFYKDMMASVNGGVVIIFNNLSHMKEIYNCLERTFPEKKFYLQTDDIQSIDFDENSVILGCSILREGIDMAGRGVKYVIIDKLPFENVSDIYVNAKMEYYEQHIGNAFLNYYLPRAVIFFKQAVGRLIRNESDSGYWIILDNRILTKNYGKYFLDVLKGAEIVSEIR